MINKGILQHNKQKDKEAIKFFITITLLLSVAIFILAMNSVQSDSQAYAPIAMDTRLAEPQLETIEPHPEIDGSLTDTVEAQTQIIELVGPVSESQTLEPAQQPDDMTLALSQPVSSQQPESFVEPPKNISYTHTIKTGDTFSNILEEYGNYAIIRKLIESNTDLGFFNSLLVGKKIIFTQKDGVLSEIAYQISPLQSYKINYQANGSYKISKEILEVEQLETHATVEITDSLYLSAKRIGLSDKLIISVANILEWDLDFTYDVRRGDYFSVIYYENYVKNKKIGEGPVLALRFTGKDKDYRIVRYTDVKEHTDYYFTDGRKVRRAFLRNPLEFSYVSSHFNPRRKHPILHKVRAHKGVDYAARRGTPVRASGDGRISMRQFYNGYGNTVILNHGGGYSTLYAHLYKFADKQRVDSWVKQGQVIGYVGSTGLSTGPHLHYEFRVNGIHRNPLTVKLPDAVPIAKSELSRFEEHSRPIIEKLHLLNDAYLANKNTD